MHKVSINGVVVATIDERAASALLDMANDCGPATLQNVHVRFPPSGTVMVTVSGYFVKPDRERTHA